MPYLVMANDTKQRLVEDLLSHPHGCFQMFNFGVATVVLCTVVKDVRGLSGASVGVHVPRFDWLNGVTDVRACVSGSCGCVDGMPGVFSRGV